MDPVNITVQLTSNLQPLRLMFRYDPLSFWLELAYALIIATVFIFIFFKTKHLFDLTKHEGIKYFRISFLLFSLAYISRLVFFLIMLYIRNISGIHIPGRFIMTSSIILVTYFSTLAIGYLIYSSVWKKVNYWVFFVGINFLALISILLIYLRYPFTYFLIIQLILMIILIFVSSNKKIQFVYPLMSLFWIFNLVLFHSRKLIGFETKIAFQVASIFLIAYFIYRILKWTK